MNRCMFLGVAVFATTFPTTTATLAATLNWTGSSGYAALAGADRLNANEVLLKGSDHDVNVERGVFAYATKACPDCELHVKWPSVAPKWVSVSEEARKSAFGLDLASPVEFPPGDRDVKKQFVPSVGSRTIAVDRKIDFRFNPVSPSDASLLKVVVKGAI